MNRTVSSACRRYRPSKGLSGPRPVGGFTLIEIVVAMVLLALISSALVGVVRPMIEAAEARSFMRDLATGVVAARNIAHDRREIVDVVVNTASGRVRFTSSDRVLTAPQRMSLGGVFADDFSSDEEGVIRFYPDGSSSGGRIDVDRDGASWSGIRVDWLFGRIEVRGNDR